MKSAEFITESAARELAKKLPSLAKHDYSTIDQLVKQVSHRHGIDHEELEKLFKKHYKHYPHDWIKSKLKEKKITESYSNDIQKRIVTYKDARKIYNYYSTILKENGYTQTVNASTEFINYVFSSEYRQLYENHNPEIKQFYDRVVSHINNLPRIKIRVGGSICLLQCILDLYSRTVIYKGFQTPKKITDIKYYNDHSGKIKFITFEDGSTFPEKYEFSTTDFGLDLVKTMFFDTPNKMEQTMTFIALVMPDGYRLGTGMLNESLNTNNMPRPEHNPLVKKFVEWCSRELKLQSTPDIEYSYDTGEAQAGHHTGRHVEGSNEIWVYVKDRNLVDILRTIAHELRHVQQSEQGKIKPGSSYPFSPIEQDADRWAGGIIKIFGKQHPEIYQ